jgi:lysophospholipase L1-like esterase
MPINIQTSEQYQSVIEKAGSPQNSPVLNFQKFDSASPLPPASDFGVGVAQVGTGLSVSDGSNFVGIPKALSNRILFFGTSITASLSSTLTPPSNAQEIRLANNSYAFWMMAALGWPVTSFINAGVGGNTTTQMVAMFSTDVLAQYVNFDVVLFEPGPNDFSHDEILLAEIQSNYTTIIEGLIKAGKRVIVLAPTASNSPDYLTNWTALGVQKRNQLLAWLKPYLATKQNVIYVNADEVMADPATGNLLAALTTDGVHPTTSGAQVLGRWIAKHVSQWFTSSVDIHLPARCDRQYMPNPRLQGNNASGVNNCYAGAGITVTGGSDATAYQFTKGTWIGGTNTATIAPYANTGIEDAPAGGTLITVVNAPSDQAELTIAFGGNYNSLGGTQYGYLNGGFGWATSKAVKRGDHAKATGFNTGIWTCIGPGTTAGSGTVPLPASETSYGQIIKDGTVYWVWQKIPAVGDTFIAEIKYEIKSLTGSMNFGASALLIGASQSVADTYGSCSFPYTDNTTGNPGGGYPGIYLPRKGSLRTPEFTLIQPSGNPMRYAEIDLVLSFMAGGGCQLYIPEINLIRTN